MTAEGRSQTKNLSLSQLNRIDAVCARFEAEQSDSTDSSRPTLEAYLDGFGGLERAELLRELLSLDVELREQRGETPTAADYAQMTAAADQTIVHSVFDTMQRMPSQIDTGVPNDTSGPAAHKSNSIPTSPLEIGTRIRSYELKRCLGEGGMGVVYLAEQSEPISRQVALKVVRSELSSTKIVARFQQERQALAAMDHPNVAKVLDAGTSETGAPYFVMELVDGLPITDHCNQHNLGIRDRLRLFLQVCQAVQHAHQKGIIHRDLKPSNVLVTHYDGEAVPKVIDFGLATAAREGVIRNPSKTDVGTVMGTFQYMSPEQADTGNADVDTRSDVYSLGVLLFELLTGRTPISTEELQTSSYFEVLQRIREAEPIAPSQSVPRATPSPSETSQPSPCFGRDYWKRSLRGELDWITLRSLAKDRDDRYETVLALADDIQRHLNNEPVAAGPLSARYRVGKFVRRNKVPVAAASIAAVALTTGLILATVGLVRAKRATENLDFANQNLLVTNKTLDRELRLAQEARDAEGKAKDRARTDAATTEAVNRFLGKILETASPYKLGKEATVLAALDYASQNIDQEFPNRPRVKMSVLASLASTYNALGEYAKAESHGRTAVELYAATVGAEDLSTLRAKDQLASILFARGQHEDAIKLMQSVCDSMKQQFGLNHKDTLITLNNLATFLAEENRLSEAIDTLKQVLAGKRALLPENDDSTLLTWSNLSALRSRIGEKQQAVEDMQRIFAITKAKHGPRHHQTIAALDHLAITQSYLDVEEAIPMYEELLELRSNFFGADHPMTVRTKLLLSTSHLGQGNAVAAEPLLRECVAWNGANSASRGTRFVSADSQLILALTAQGVPEKAAEAEQVAEAFLAFVQQNAPPNSPPQLQARVNLGISVLAQARYEEAESILRECYNDALKFERLPPDLVGLVQTQLGIALLHLDRREEAVPLVKDGYQNLQRIKGDDHVATRQAADAATELGIESSR